MIAVRHRKAALFALLAVPFLLYFYFFYHMPQSSYLTVHDNYAAAGGAKPSSPSEELKLFWPALLGALTRTKPDMGQVKVDKAVDDSIIDPNAPNRTDTWPDRISLSEYDEESLRRSHVDFVAAMEELAPQLPFKKKARGVVMTAGGRYIGIAITSLLMLRRTGSKLPVELFLDSEADYDEEVCGKVLPSLGAECLIMDRLWDLTPGMPKLKTFQFKAFSIIFSSFQQVLFLDADCWPAAEPDYLFHTEPYRSRGLVTWPDFWLLTSSPIFYRVAGIEVPALTERLSSESGIMLYDKAKHARSLLLAAYYNFYGPDYYYPLLSQGATGQGDKETFLHAALVLGSPFYDVKTHIGIMGRWINGSFESSAMKQADPRQDFELTQSPRKPKKVDADKDGKLGKHFDQVHARWLFVHHNLIKIDSRYLNGSLDKAFRMNGTAQYQRLWGLGRLPD